MKKFIVYLLVIVMAVSLGFAVFYLVKDDEVISISSASIYTDVNKEFAIDIKHENKKSYTTIDISSSNEDVVKHDKDNNTFKALAGGVARINFRTNNVKFRNLWCDVIVGDGTENNLGVIGNVLPAVEQALNGIGKLIEGAIPVLIERLPGLLQQILPVLLSSATSLVNSVVEVLPELVDLIVDTLIDNAPMLIVAAVELMLALAGGLIEAIPKILAAIPTIIKETVAGFEESKNIQKFVDVGKNVVNGILSGLKQAWEGLKRWFSNAWNNLVGGVKDLLGIHSPSRVFAGIGKNMALGVGEGWGDEYNNIKKDITKGLNFETASIDVNASAIGRASHANEFSVAPQTFVLQLPDGDVLASFMVDILRKEARLA